MRHVIKNAHFTIETRIFIEEELSNNVSITDISKKLFRDRSNIGREISKHKTVKFPPSFNRNNPCKYYSACSKRYLSCFTTCTNFVEFNACETLNSSPHVCNGCSKKQCTHVRYYYIAKEANTQYLNSLVKSRSKMHYTDLELNVLNNDFYNLVIQTKSIYHSIRVVNLMGFNFNAKTIYRQIKAGMLRLKSSDLPRENITKKTVEIDKSYKREISGHTYEDYQAYKLSNPKTIEWQMDCVQGIQGKEEPVLLTLQIVEIKFLFIFLINKQSADEVLKKLKEFKNHFSTRRFNKLLEILLTDNGHEFIKLKELMKLLPRTHIFYCHPYSSYEKGSIENNHELIRRVIPQGVSLKCYIQEDINLLCSNINSLYREELDGKCPFDLINKFVSKEILDKLGLKYIAAKEVSLIPELLGEKNITNIKKYLSKAEIKKSHITFMK